MTNQIIEIVGPPESGKSFALDYLSNNYNFEVIQGIRASPESYPQSALLAALADTENFLKIGPWIKAMSLAAHYESFTLIKNSKKPVAISNYFWGWAALMRYFKLPFNESVLQYFHVPRYVICMPSWSVSSGTSIPTNFPHRFKREFGSKVFSSFYLNKIGKSILGPQAEIKVLTLNPFGNIDNKYRDIDSFLPNKKINDYTNSAYWAIN